MKSVRRMLILAAAGFVAGFLLATWGFVALWWEFPRTWQPLGGLPEAPRELLALNAEDGTSLLRTAGGRLATCQGQECTPAGSDWSSADTRCDRSNQPASVSLFPYLLSRKIRVAFACERGFMSTARTLYVVHLADGSTWQSTGVGLLPIDVVLLGVGLLGGLAGLLAGLVLGGIVAVGRALTTRRRASGAARV